MALLAQGPWEQGPPSLVGVWPPVAKGVVLPIYSPSGGGAAQPKYTQPIAQRALGLLMI